MSNTGGPGPNDPQLIEVSLASGLDESTDDSMTPATKCRLANNIVFPDTMTAQKRQGLTTAVANSGLSKLFAHDTEILGINASTWQVSAYSKSQGGLVSRGPITPCMASRALLATANAPADGNQVPQVAAFNTPIMPFASEAADPITGYRINVWTNGSTLVSSIFDTKSNSYVQTATVVGAADAGDYSGKPANQPRVVLLGSVAFVFFWSALSGVSVQYIGIDLANVAGGWGSQASTGGIIDDVNGMFDACQCFAGAGGATPQIALVVGSNTSGTVLLQTLYNGGSGTVLSAGAAVSVASWTPGAPNAIDCIGIAGTPPQTLAASNQIAIAFGYEDTSPTTHLYLKWSVWEPRVATFPTVITALTTLETGTIATTASGPNQYRAVGLVATFSTGTGPGVTQQWGLVLTRDYQVVAPAYGGSILNTQDNTTSFYYRAQATDNSSGKTYGPTLGYQTLSKPIVYAPVASGAQTIFALAVAQDGNRLVFSNPRVAAPKTLVLLQLPISYGGASWQQPIPSAVSAPQFAGDVVPLTMDAAYLTTGSGFTMLGAEQENPGITSITSLTFDFANVNLWQAVRLGAWTYIAGGLPMIYDGSSLTEVAFVNQPAQVPYALPVAGASVIPAIQQLTYQIVYSQLDALGNIHRSPPSIATILDASAGYPKVKLAIQTLNVTLRENVAGINSASPVRIEIYRNNSGTAGGGGTPTTMQLLAVTANDPSIPILYWEDTSVDGFNGSAPTLYTAGLTAAPPTNPPNLSGLAVHADRMWGVSDDGQTSYFSTELITGEAPRWSGNFTVSWPQGPITAQWSLENRLHAATLQKTFFVFGQGPDDNGLNSDLTQPDVWQSYLGVIDTRGVCLFQGGAVLNTGRGIYVEDRTGNFTWLGWRFQRTYDANPIVTGMAALDEAGAVRIALQTTGGNTAFGSPVIHWDYWNDKIATHSQFPQSGMLSIANANGTYWTLANVGGGTTGSLLFENPATCLDGTSTWVTMAIEPGWMHPQGVQGYARMKLVMVLGYQNTPSGINLQVARDYALQFDSAEGAWQDFQIAASTNAPTFQVQFRPATEKCEAASFLINDVPPGSLSVGTGQGPTFKAILARWAFKQGQYKRLGSTYTE
jgi:hypothetical protein